MNRSGSRTNRHGAGGGIRGQRTVDAARRLNADGTGAPLLSRVGRAQSHRSQPHSLLTHRAHARPGCVLMTADCIGGVWTYALDLARGLCAEGVHVVLATMGDLPTPGQRQEAQGIANLTLCPGSFKLEWMPEPWQDVERAGDWLLALEAQFAPDIVHLNGYAHSALAWKAPVLVAAHSCVLSWWQAVKSEAAPAEWQTYKDIVTRGVQAAQTVVAPTRAMLNALASYYGPLSSSCVIPNGRQADLYQTGSKQPIILTAGRLWDEAKNIDALRQVAPRLIWPIYAAGCPGSDVPTDVQTTLEVGHKPPGSAVQLLDLPEKSFAERTHSETASELLPAGGFRPLGRLTPDELAGWYARAAIYALPARYEPFGLSALEAALSGCALVLGDIASLREVWGDAALFVPPHDTDALARALNRLIINPALRREMAERAYIHAQQYTLQAMTNAYLECYAALLPVSTHTFVHEAATLVPLDHIDPIEDDERQYTEEWRSVGWIMDEEEAASEEDALGSEGTQA